MLHLGATLRRDHCLRDLLPLFPPPDALTQGVWKKEVVGDCGQLLRLAPFLLQHAQLAFQRPALRLLIYSHLQGQLDDRVTRRNPAGLRNPRQPVPVPHTLHVFEFEHRFPQYALWRSQALDLVNRVTNLLWPSTTHVDSRQKAAKRAKSLSPRKFKRILTPPGEQKTPAARRIGPNEQGFRCVAPTHKIAALYAHQGPSLAEKEDGAPSSKNTPQRDTAEHRNGSESRGPTRKHPEPSLVLLPATEQAISVPPRRHLWTLYPPDPKQLRAIW